MAEMYLGNDMEFANFTLLDEPYFGEYCKKMDYCFCNSFNICAVEKIKNKTENVNVFIRKMGKWGEERERIYL